MDYQEIWNELCFKINKKKNVSEDEYQPLFEQLFDKLDWSERRGELVCQHKVRAGTTTLRADIVIKNGDIINYVVEIKRPGLPASESYVEQLRSYMKQLDAEFGILIGNTLQVCRKNHAKMVCDIKFEENSKDGAEILRILAKEGYTFERFQQYCEDRLKAENEREMIAEKINNLCSENGRNEITELLREKLLQENYSVENVEKIITGVNISITERSATIKCNESGTMINDNNSGIKIGKNSEVAPPSVRPFYVKLKEYIEKNDLSLEVKFAGDRHWCWFISVNGYVKILTELLEKENKVRIGFYLERKKTENLYEKLFSRKAQINSALEKFKVNWKEKTENSDNVSRIETYIHDFNEENVADCIMAFVRVFEPIFTELGITHKNYC